MSGSALPIVPLPEKPGPASSKATAQPRDKTAASAYDDVSVQERRRLERRDVAAESRQVSAKPPQSAAHDDARPEIPADQAIAGPRKTSESDNEKARAETSDGETDTPTTGLAGVASDVFLEPEAVFTFANLQALVGGEEEPFKLALTGSGATAQGSSGGLLPEGLSAMLVDKPGLKQQLPGLESEKVAKAGARLIENVMGQVSADSGKIVDLTTATATGRFQGALELASQQLAPNAVRLPEAPVPLRGYATSIELPVGHAQWGDKLVGKLTWLTSQKMSVAEIHLTPPDMGPMEVRVQVQNDQANVTVHAANPAVRDQLELHSHRLRDMLQGQGLDLQSFDVTDSSDQASGGERDGDQSANGQGLSQLIDEGDLAENSGALDLAWRGEVDLYA
ncbi:flagellar hook-length control protein FliK [Marinobacter salicampi]|uniref:flagellar hook-length control protein FliK n=1 Tax=Marinobacter salicampi TaxID=435907 RepID=UPI0014077A04|nr:flagellar hook-length control protein FliK [Marinobacter salicampi]